MTNVDEILLEQRISYRNMTKEERNFCINLILNSKDVSDSDVYINQHGLSRYDILFMNFTRIDDAIHFNGVVYNEYENRWIDGHILKDKSISFDSCESNERTSKETYYMKTNVYRCNDFIYGEDKEYTVSDLFYIKTINKKGSTTQSVMRKSRYENTTYFETEIQLLNDEAMESYLDEFVRTLKLK